MDTSKSKPDLMAGASRGGDNRRILAQLEHGVRPQASAARLSGWNIDGWTIGLCLLLLLMCSVAWLLHDRRITPESFRARTTAAPSVHREVETMISNEVPAAAAIINQREAGNGEADAAASAIEADQAPARRPQVAATQPRAARNAASPPTLGPRAIAKPPAPASGDTDVTLLTALVAHATKPTTVAPERSRDVVERQEGDTTIQLLARCKQLGMIEGMLCRSRICSGRWENDDACRAPEH